MHSFVSPFFDKMTNAKQDSKSVYRKLKLEEYVQEKLDRLDRPVKSYSHFMLDSQPNYCYPLRPSAPLPAHGLNLILVRFKQFLTTIFLPSSFPSYCKIFREFCLLYGGFVF